MSPPLVFLHGWGASPEVWREVRGALAPGRASLAPALPGHGGGEAPAAFDEAVEGVARTLPPQADLCGWSLGALFALAIAARFPRRVRRLALVGATPCFVARGDWDCGMEKRDFEAFARGMDDDPQATRSRFAALCVLGGRAGRATARALGRLLEGAPTPHANALGWLRATDLRRELGAIGSPTLLVHGTLDRVAAPEGARRLADALGEARLAEIGDAAHVPFVSHRDRFVRELESFVG